MTTSTPPTEPPRLSVGIAIDVGRSRKGKPNQDSLGTYQDYVYDPALLRTKGLLFVVADGMGGAAGGKEASETAVQSIIQGYYDDTDPNPQVCLEHAIQAANTEIGQIGRANPDLRGLGTTLVVTLILGQRVLVANVGDSRVYLLRRGRLRQLSLDHTVVQEHLRAGLLSPEEAMVHPRRHVLSRNLGSRPEAQPDYAMETLQIGDIVLLCSDGLWGPVSDYEISQLLKQDTQPAADTLIERANAQGGPDNISAIVVRVDAWGAPAEPVRAPITQPITQPLANDPASQRVAPATVLLDEPAEPTPAAPPSVPSVPNIATQAAALAATQRMTPPPTRPSVPAAITPESVTSGNLREKIGEPPAAMPPPRKHGVWMIPAIVGGIILALILIFIVVRPVSAPTTAVLPPTAEGTFAVAPTGTSPATPSTVSTIATANEATAAPTLAVAVVPNATVGATATELALPTVTRAPTALLAETALPIIAATTSTDDTTSPATTARATSSGGVSTGGPEPTSHADIAFAADGSVLALAPNGQVMAWNPATGISTTASLLTDAQTVSPETVRGTMAGPYVDGSIVRLRLTEAGVISGTLQIDDPASVPLPVTLAVFSPDGTKLVYATDNGAIRFWDQTNGPSTALTTHSQNTITSIVWSRDGALFATATDDGKTEIWEQTGRLQRQIEQNANVVALAFDPTSAFLASLSDEPSVRVVTLASGELSQLIAPIAPWSALTFDATGSFLTAGAEDGTLIVWRDPLTANVNQESVGESNSEAVAALAFAPDSTQLAALGADGTVRFLPVSSR